MCVCACMHYVCVSAPSLPCMRSLRSLTRPNAKPTSGPNQQGLRRTIGQCRLLHCGERNAQSRRIRLALPEGPPRRADERAPIHCPAEDHDGMGSPRKRSPTARPERKRRRLGLSGNRLGFRSQWLDSRSARRSLRNGAWVCVHRCARRQAVRPQASTALHERRPRSAQRRRLRTIAAA